MRRTWVSEGIILIAVSLLVFWPARMAGQGLFGTISGVVTDPSGAVVPGATVRVTNVGTNATTTLIANGAGVYSATSLNPGTYNVEAQAKGFKAVAMKGIVLEVGANAKANLVLEVGPTTQTVEVTATQAPFLQTQQSNLGQTVTERELDQLPT
ncbi:MAG TPA: carboxypeptidase-like regulatory domain-containing protein [Terriglobia bacterium]|jgi:hypothetical protein|nr:carboxypeptidase-like regulatory domain-containing protein [Terriglobia bacterium]